MAKYQQYKEYKDSGVEWLGVIPSHWDLRKFKHHFRSAMGETILGADLIDYGKFPVYSATEGDCFFGYVNSSSVVLEKGDFVIPARGNSIGFPKLVVTTSTCSQTTIYAKMHKKIHSKFTFYYLLGCKPYLFQFVQTAIPQITVEEVKNNYLVYPSPEEQTKIANFLDHETAKIDSLIEKQQQLIQLLKEKRQAVISHAVTKGLDPSVKMKNSGVEWLGEVPEHWVKIKLKFIVKNIIDAEHKTAPYFEDGEYLVCRTTNVRNGQLKLDGGKYTNQNTYNEWTQRAVPQIGDILFTREAPAGEACVYDGSVPLCLGQRMVLFKLDQSIICPDFVLYSIYSGLADDFIKQLSQGSTVTHFNMSDIQNIPLFEPPRNEQIKIKEYLIAVTGRYDELISKAESAIQLMQERRTALISAAVTGKIDVRNWQNPSDTKTELSA